MLRGSRFCAALLYEAAPSLLPLQNVGDRNAHKKLLLSGILTHAAMAHFSSYKTAFVLYR